MAHASATVTEEGVYPSIRCGRDHGRARTAAGAEHDPHSAFCIPQSKVPPQRRASDRKPVKIIGWIACLALAASLTYTFVRALLEGPDDIDPLFFGMQTVASLLFLVYSVKLRNGVFIAANSIALVNAVGTFVIALRVV
jgi:hypothetical protein